MSGAVLDKLVLTSGVVGTRRDLSGETGDIVVQRSRRECELVRSTISCEGPVRNAPTGQIYLRLRIEVDVGIGPSPLMVARLLAVI